MKSNRHNYLDPLCIIIVVVVSVLVPAQTATDVFTAKITEMSANLHVVNRALEKHVAVEKEFFKMSREIMALKNTEELEIMDRHIKRIQEILREP